MMRGILTTLIIFIGFFLVSCQLFQANELSKPSSTAGFNGGFEITDSGYPVNWAFGPNPENSGTFEVFVDSTHVMEGKNSLKLVINQSDRTVAIRSRRIPVQPGKSYRTSLWVTNGGCSIKVNSIMTDASGMTHMPRNAIISTSTPSEQWQQFEDTLSVSANEANIFLIFRIDGPCTFWGDDVRIEEVTE